MTKKRINLDAVVERSCVLYCCLCKREFINKIKYSANHGWNIPRCPYCNLVVSVILTGSRFGVELVR